MNHKNEKSPKRSDESTARSADVGLSLESQFAFENWLELELEKLEKQFEEFKTYNSTHKVNKR